MKNEESWSQRGILSWRTKRRTQGIRARSREVWCLSEVGAGMEGVVEVARVGAGFRRQSRHSQDLLPRRQSPADMDSAFD